MTEEFYVGESYRMRSGSMARVTGQRKDHLLGYMREYPAIKLEWTKDGRRVPVGGEDPCDLVPPK